MNEETQASAQAGAVLLTPAEAWEKVRRAMQEAHDTVDTAPSGAAELRGTLAWWIIHLDANPIKE